MKDATCTEMVWREYHDLRCGKPAQYDGGTKCGRHSSDAKARRDAKRAERNARLRAEWDASARLDQATADAVALVRLLASEGYARAQEIASRLDA